MSNPTYTLYTTLGPVEVDYTPRDSVSNLCAFDIARCARDRMIDNVLDNDRWKGERKSFYSWTSRVTKDINTSRT